MKTLARVLVQAAPLLVLTTMALGREETHVLGREDTHFWDHLEGVAAPTVQHQVMVRMRDGTRLSTQVILPNGANGKLPTILSRAPYPQDHQLEPWMPKLLLAHGYAVVVQNERGTGWSEGTYHFLAGARNDGYDTLTWIAQQPWSNGKVGTLGCSSPAEHQLALAAMNHPAHKAMVAMGPSSGVGDIPGVHTQGEFYKGGVPSLDWARWYSVNGPYDRPKLPDNISQDERERLAERYSPWLTPELRMQMKAASAQSVLELPSQDVLRRIGVPPTDFDTFIKISPADPQWQKIDFIRSGDKPRVPALLVDSWHDNGAFNTVKLFEYVQQTPNQFLIVAPTGHCEMAEATEHTLVGQRSMGDARYDYAGLIIKWFDHWLKDEQNGVLERPKVQTYEMGANLWQSYSSWPAPGTAPMRLFLHSKGRANSIHGNGGLSTASPAAEPSDSFISDPLHPVPSAGGGDILPPVQDQTDVELRDDVLVFSTEVLQQGISLTGEVNVTLYVSSSAPDADLSFKLIDVYPDGKAFNVGDTMLRLRYREGYDKAVMMKPGEIYAVQLSGMVTSNYFAEGHRLRIAIAGSDFPVYERNLQTGGHNFDESKPNVATLVIHHDSEHASFVQFPVTTKTS